jgi:hypothetical protein
LARSTVDLLTTIKTIADKGACLNLWPSRGPIRRPQQVG